MHHIGRWIARYLSKPRPQLSRRATSEAVLLAQTIRKGDILLVEGTSRISAAIKYVTQSTWSHAALFIGNTAGEKKTGAEEKTLLEADLNEGVRTVPLSEYAGSHTRICRAVGLTAEEVDRVISYASARLGHRYDLKNVFDLARYFIQTPPVPIRWRRQLLALGSGDPTRAICSSLIAEAFQSVRYPILPEVSIEKSAQCQSCDREILHIRHHSLFAPRDFDVSPYFDIIKPAIEKDFDPHQLHWGDDMEEKG